MRQEAADCSAVTGQILGFERAHCVGQSTVAPFSWQRALDFPDVARSLAHGAKLPSVLGNITGVHEDGGKVVALYSAGDKGRAIATFAEEVARADFRG